MNHHLVRVLAVAELAGLFHTETLRTLKAVMGRLQ